MLWRMTHTAPARETTLRGLLKFQFGVADADSVANPLAAAAKAAGYEDEYDMALSVLFGRGAKAAVPERRGKGAAVNARRRRVRAANPGEETEEDKKVPDDEFLLELSAMLEDSPGGARGTEWYRGLVKTLAGIGTMTMTKDGFYARVAKLVANGKVRSSQSKMPTKLYGRDVLMNVTLYSLPEETTPAKIGGVS